jgi:hypothetical protein
LSAANYWKHACWLVVRGFFSPSTTGASPTPGFSAILAT